MTSWRCGKPTKDGRPCGWHTPPCFHHPDRVDTSGPARERATTPGGGAVIGVLATDSSLRRAIDERNLHGVAWSLLGDAVKDEPKNASLISTLVRVLASLGPAPEDDEALLQQIVVHARAMWGMAPETDDEWELASQLFDDEALGQFRRWGAAHERLAFPDAALAHVLPAPRARGSLEND